MAALLKRELGVEAELLVGRSGEFTVWVDDKLVAEKTSGQFPDPDEVVRAVRTVAG
ncbi:MAG: Rdx family [Deltaproteobacteria bacterium]|nr:Rdx family [Deltaproteobacteria bacterium]